MTTDVWGQWLMIGAEKRIVELMKDAGFYAVYVLRVIYLQTESSMPCDRLGLWVIDKTFDGWRDSKNQYHYSMLYDQRCPLDIDSMILRDRLHPSNTGWSTGI
jgi:Beta-galactosidase/beta-glucuronidase